jgi:nucleoside phosphorylase
MTRVHDDLDGTGIDATRIRVGILTALPEEYVAVRSLLHSVTDLPARQDPHQYCSGWFRSKDPDLPHYAVLALQTLDGTRFAATACTDMLRSFPGMRVVIMCGIAGGVPAPNNPKRDVRLGDIVVATDGIVDYGHVRLVDGIAEQRRTTSGISAALIRADRALQTLEISGEKPWLDFIDTVAAGNPLYRRPPAETDPLHQPSATAGAPPASVNPQVWRGMIGSADTLLRDTRFRDDLATRYNLLAVEMEGAGVAAAAGAHDLHWFQIRGICDYCDNKSKNDIWHEYAALVAAGYVASVLTECPPFRSEHSDGVLVSNLQMIVDTLLNLPQLSDDHQRRAILAILPGHIRNSVPDSVTARIHVVGLVRTCERIPGGRNALLNALRLALGPDSPDYHRIADAFHSYWSEA